MLTESKNSLHIECTILVVKWDEIYGPVIVDIQPAEKRQAMESVAVQIYFSGVAIFGHEWTPQRAELSFPLVSLGPEYIVKVGFDAWEDEDVRGGYRPFYIGFVMTHDCADVLQHFIDLRMSSYLDELKKQKTINLSKIYAEMVSYFKRLSSTKQQEKKLQQVFDDTQAYTIKDAQQDLDEAVQLWNSTKSLESGWKAERAALFLEKFDPKSAGEAYFLAGNAYFHHNEFHRASDIFSMAAKNFLKAEENEKAAKSFYLAGTASSYIKQWSDAETFFKQAITWTKDEHFLVDLHLALAKVHEAQGKWNKALENYQESLNIANALDDAEKIAEIHLAKAALYRYMFKETDQSDIIYSRELQKSTAEELKKAAIYWEQCQNYYKAAVSYLQSAQLQVKIGEHAKGIEAYEKALELFTNLEGIFHKAQNILQLSELIKKDINQHQIPLSETQNLLKTLLTIEQKIVDEIEKEPIKGHLSIEKNFLLGGLLIDQTKIYHFFDNKAEQVKCLKKAKEHLVEHPSLEKYKIWTLLQLANLYYELELYANSFQEYQKLTQTLMNINDDGEAKKGRQPSVTSIRLDEEQIKKIVQNYVVSAQQLSIAYYHAGLISFYDQQFEMALNHFKSSFRVLINTLKTSRNLSPSLSDTIHQLIQGRVLKLKEKISLLMIPQFQRALKEQLESVIEELKDELSKEKTSNTFNHAI